MKRNEVIPALLLGLVIASAALPAQTASSTNYFMPSGELANGGRTSSLNYRLEASLGAGVTGQRTTSTGYRLVGGYIAGAQAPLANQAWVSDVRSRFGPITGGTVHTVHGHALDLGSSTSVTIGGLAATVTRRASDRLTVTLPAQARPGWQPLTVTNAGGSATRPRAIGVYPMADKWPSAIENTQPFRVTYRGRPGDLVYLAVATATVPAAIPVPPYRHGLRLNPGALIGTIGPLPVTDPSGEFSLSFPGIGFPRPLYVQMLGVSGAAPYAPGSFTNVIAL